MDFWFLFKKSISIYVHPLTIAMELMVIGVVLVGFSRRAKKKKPGKFGRWLKRVSGDLGVAAVIAGVFFLFLSSIKPVADPLVYGLEKRYPPLQLEKLSNRDIAAIAPEFIVVLAGGERYDPEKPPTSLLSYAAQSRVNEGARMAAVFPDATMVFTGQPDEVRAMTESIQALGVSRDRIRSESESRDTKDHPRLLRPIIGDSRFLLVTSGTHMPRSMALFEAEGYEPIPAACDLWVWPRFAEENPYRPENFIPRVEHLWMTNTAFHEYLGLAWAKLIEARLEREAVAAPDGGEDLVEPEMTDVSVSIEVATEEAPLPLPVPKQKVEAEAEIEKTVPKKTETPGELRGPQPAPSSEKPKDHNKEASARERAVFL